VLDVAALRRAAENPPPPTAETVPRPAPWRDATTFAKRRLLPAALLCSLAANGFLVAHLVARGGGEEAAQLAATLTESAPTVPAVTAVATAAPSTKGAGEGKVVGVVRSAAAQR